MIKILTTVVLLFCITSFAQVEKPLSHTRKMVKAESIDDTQTYIYLSREALGEEAYLQLIKKYGSRERYEDSVRIGMKQKPSYDSETFWITDNLKVASEKSSSFGKIFKGKELRSEYALIFYGDEKTSNLQLFQQHGSKWLLITYPRLGEGIFIEK